MAPVSRERISAKRRLWRQIVRECFSGPEEHALHAVKRANGDRQMADSGKLSSEGQRALELFKTQLDVMPTIRNFRGVTPEFAQWKDATTQLFLKYLPDSSCYNRFSIIQFGAAHSAPDRYLRGCDLAEQCIRAAIQDIERSDVKAAGRS
jgi:hypothetical protein